MNHEIKYSVLVWFKFWLTVWDCQADAGKTTTVPKSGKLLILHWYFWNRSSFVHTCIKYTLFSSLEHCDSHVDGIKRSPARWGPKWVRGHRCTCSVCLKEKLGARKPCAPFLHTESWGTSKQTYSRCHRQSMVGLGTESRFPESYPVS